MFLFSYVKKSTLKVFNLMIFKSMFELFLPFVVGMQHLYLVFMTKNGSNGYTQGRW